MASPVAASAANRDMSEVILLMSDARARGLDRVATIRPSELPDALGLAETLRYLPHSPDLVDRKMERDDIQVIRYLMRNLRPRRHLEFGTWEGAGTLAVLEETEATVWTINPWAGESSESGTPVYSSIYDRDSLSAPMRAPLEPEARLPHDDTSIEVRTDAGEMIGRIYREAGCGGRVCQIFADSRDWDIGNYPPGWFDTVLIDGSHDSEVVINDTYKALALVRDGGLILWHDYCPIPRVLDIATSCRGVVSAIDAIRHDLQDAFDRLWWIEDTWLLLGIAGAAGSHARPMEL
jgi:predicted O-methyltransferase YrrM